MERYNENYQCKQEVSLPTSITNKNSILTVNGICLSRGKVWEFTCLETSGNLDEEKSSKLLEGQQIVEKV